MPITKQQAMQELARRKSPSQGSSNVANQARAELARRELTKRGQMQQKPTGFQGFAKNAKTDFGSFAKGMLGVGKELVQHPIYNAKQIYGVGKEIVKETPDAAKQMLSDLKNFKEVQRKGSEAWKQLKQIPLEEQKKGLADIIQRVGESDGTKSQKDLARLGMGIMGNYTQYSRFKEKAYAEPFSLALDVLPATKALGVNKLVGKGFGQLNRIPAVAKTTEAINDAFVPMGKLKRLGYGDVAESTAKATAKSRKAQEGIIKSTVKKFEKEFKLDKAEKLDFFETIDKGRRIPGYIAKSLNPKVQKAIDWYLKEELPNIKRISGVTKHIAEVKKGLSKNLAKLQEDRLRIALKPSKKALKPKVTSGIEFKARPTRYDINAILKSALKELKPKIGDIRMKKAPLKPNVLEKSSGRILAAKRVGKRLDNFLNEQLGIKNIKQLPLDRKISIAEEILNKYKNNPEGITNYLHHFFNPTKETNFGGKLSSPSRGFLKQSKDVEGFVKDPVVAIAGVKTKAVVANIKDKFVKGVLDKYGVAKEAVTEFKGGKMFNEAGEELQKFKSGYLPKDLAEEMMRLEKGEPGWVKTILAPMRTFNRNWKPLATAVRPRYHLRNVIGNIYNASFVGGAKLRNYPSAALQQMKLHIGTQMKEGTLAGKVYKAMFKQPPEASMIRKAIQDDVIGHGFFGVDINDMAGIADTVEDFSKAIARIDTPSAVYKIPGLRQWMQGMQKFGTAIEDNARLALYIDRIKKGASRMEAKAYVNKHLFDYMNGLGEADQAIKAIIPFWSWRRFNVPLQFGALAKNPLRHLMVQEGGKPFVQQSEAENPEYKYLSQREKDMGAFKVGEETRNGATMDKYMRTQNVLPIQDLSGVTDPDNIGFSPLGSILRQGYNAINPPESPQENLDYFGRPVEQFPGENKKYLGIPVRGTVKEILGSIPALSELNKAFGGSYTDENRPSLSTRMQTVFSPTSNTVQDREKNRQYFESDYQRKYGTGTMSPGYLTEYKYLVKKALEKPQDPVVNKNLKTIIILLKEGGMNDADLTAEAEKAIQSQLKKESPKPKRPSSLRPKRPSPALDPYYAAEIKKRASNLNPFFTNQ